ncbi:MAG: hypothetical protein GY701_10535 [Sulfitobacter sp.]|nr:hypothetical protein [Sulfitobacter sp.]MCP4085358.1 hypothetical protein [Actinomycetes bacterium]
MVRFIDPYERPDLSHLAEHRLDDLLAIGIGDWIEFNPTDCETGLYSRSHKPDRPIVAERSLYRFELSDDRAARKLTTEIAAPRIDT